MNIHGCVYLKKTIYNSKKSNIIIDFLRVLIAKCSALYPPATDVTRETFELFSAIFLSFSLEKTSSLFAGIRDLEP